MILYIHSDEMADTGRTFSRHSSRDVRHLVISEGTSISDIVSRAEALVTDEDRAASATPIELLLFNGHGSPGTIYIGENITIHNVDTIGTRLGPLIKPLADGGEGIEVHCCQVAAGLVRGERPYSRTCDARPTPSEAELNQTGVRFVYRMACAFGTRVRASLDPQIADWYGFFENSMVEAMPSSEADWHGHVRQVMHSRLVRSGDTTALGLQAVFGFY